MTPATEGSPSATECTSVVAPPGSTTRSEPEPGRAGAAVGEESRAFHHGRRGGHQHPVELGLRAVDALGVHDALDEDASYRGARRLDVEHVEFRHHVRADRDLRRQHRHGFVGGIAVSGEHDGARERAPAERRRVVEQDLAVAAVGAAGQQQDVGRERDDALDVRPRQPIGERSDQPRAGAERGAARRLSGQLAHEADRHHPQPAGRAAGGKAVLEHGAARRGACSRSASAAFMPTMMSEATVDGPWPEPRTRRRSRSIARSFV